MAERVRAIRIKQIRGQIIKNLHRVGVMRSESLYRTVVGIDFDYNKHYFRQDIEYLKERGYVRFIDDAIGGSDDFDERYIKLTADGSDLACQINVDERIDI
jgi:hypothetical protein